MILWTNRYGTMPYVSRETWFTRFWLLHRKVESQDDVQTSHDARVADAMLLFSRGQNASDWQINWLWQLVEAQRRFDVLLLHAAGVCGPGMTKSSAPSQQAIPSSCRPTSLPSSV